MTLRANLGKITKRLPLLHQTLVAGYHLAVLEVWPYLKRLSNQSGSNIRKLDDLNDFLSLQSIRVVTLALPTPATDRELVAILKERDIPFYEGGWTVYLPPSEKLSDHMPQLLKYPRNSGVKILRHFEPPATARYNPDHLRPSPGAARVRVRTPEPKILLRLAGHLSVEGIGPVVHDLVELRIGDARCTAFIMEHAGNAAAISKSDYDQFLVRLDALLKMGVVDIAHGDYRISRDFQRPDCNKNLVKNSEGKTLYVDIQSFTFKNEFQAFFAWAESNRSQVLFGPRRLGKQDDYLYQMIPGVGDAKRSTTERWIVLDELLRSAGLDLGNRITFDIGCNSGLMSYYALSRGATWAYGWDKPEVAAAAQQLLRLLGASRWTAIGGTIGGDANFRSSLPANHLESRDGVLLYLAISNHIGFPNGVADLPWKYCIYEGHSSQDVDYSVNQIMASGWGAQINVLATGMISDGDSPARAIIIFSR